LRPGSIQSEVQKITISSFYNYINQKFWLKVNVKYLNWL
jgi:hypothetical protein